MKLTTGWSGDPPQDLSRGCLPLSRARENGTGAGFLPPSWHPCREGGTAAPGGVVGPVRQGVVTATPTGTPTLDLCQEAGTAARLRCQHRRYGTTVDRTGPDQ